MAERHWISLLDCLIIMWSFAATATAISIGSCCLPVPKVQVTHSMSLKHRRLRLRSRQVEAEQQARRLLERYYARLSSPDPASALAAMGPDLATGIVSTLPPSFRTLDAVPSRILEAFLLSRLQRQAACDCCRLFEQLLRCLQCMAHEGEEAHGQAAALKQLRSACELQLALGATRIAATSIEIQELQARCFVHF